MLSSAGRCWLVIPSMYVWWCCAWVSVAGWCLARLDGPGLRKTYFSVLHYTVLGDIRRSLWVSAKGVVLGECPTETHSPLNCSR